MWQESFPFLSLGTPWISWVQPRLGLLPYRQLQFLTNSSTASQSVGSVPENGCGSTRPSALVSKQSRIQAGNGSFDVQEQFSDPAVGNDSCWQKSLWMMVTNVSLSLTPKRRECVLRDKHWGLSTRLMCVMPIAAYTLQSWFAFLEGVWWDYSLWEWRWVPYTKLHSC